VRGAWRAQSCGRWRSGPPYGLGVCCSAGVSAGMASLAACSTEGAFGWRRGRWVKGTKARSKAGRTSDTTRRARKKQTTEDTEVDENGRTRRSAATGRGIGWRRGRWVKGTKAGSKAGRTSDTTRRARKKQTTEDTEDTEVDENGRTRRSAATGRGIGWRRGRWVKGAKAGWKACPTRAACPTRVAAGGGGARSSACHAASLGGGWRGNARNARDCVALPARPPAWQAWRLAPRELPAWQARRLVPRRGWCGKAGESLFCGWRWGCAVTRRAGGGRRCGGAGWSGARRGKFLARFRGRARRGRRGSRSGFG